MREQILMRVMKLMNWELEKAILWYESDNPNFGGSSPEKLVQRGRWHKIRDFIDAAEQENKPVE